MGEWGRGGDGGSAFRETAALTCGGRRYALNPVLLGKHDTRTHTNPLYLRVYAH
jgi:hypothetical protein